jgi:hypothetical protein
MPPRQTDEERADFASALQAIAQEEPLSTAQLDALSVLEGDDLSSFGGVWDGLAAPHKIRVLTALRGAAEQRLRLDFNAIDRLAMSDADPLVRRAAIECTLEDTSAALLDKLLDLVGSDPDARVRLSAAEDLARFTLLGELEDLDPETTERARSALLHVVHDAQ